MKKNLLNYKGLYGDNSQHELDNFVHYELLVTRSKLYNWEINEHLHTDLFQIFIITSGKGILIQDSNRIPFESPCILLIPTNTFHGFEYQSDASGEVLTISDQFIETIFAKTPLMLLELNKAKQYKFNDENQNILNDLLYLKDKIIKEITDRNTYKQLCLESLFQLFFIELHRLNILENEKKIINNRTLTYFHTFQKLIKKTLPESKLIKDYANELRITPVHLNRICQSLVQKSALQLIHDFTITEAKKYLIYTSYSVSEISYLLNFKDPAYFSRLFKKQTGFSPNQFRNGTTSKI